MHASGLCLLPVQAVVYKVKAMGPRSNDCRHSKTCTACVLWNGALRKHAALHSMHALTWF